MSNNPDATSHPTRPAAAGPVCVALAALVCIHFCTDTPRASGSAIIGTYVEDHYLIADGTTVYRMWVYADNTGLNGDITDGINFRPAGSSMITPVPDAFGRAPVERDFFEGRHLVFEATLAWTQPSGYFVATNEGSANKIGDLQWYDFTVNPGTPIGQTSFNIAATWTIFSDPLAVQQPFSVQNQPFFVIPSIPGDADVDGDIDLDDFDILASNYGQAGKTWFDGDFDLDGDVDFDDYVKLALHLGEVAPDTVLANIPSPATATLLLVGLLLVSNRKHKSPKAEP